ncbi:MAG: DUF4445 domain-containing protein [Clostridiales bacterium]|nr:DUF4445 domain-containing protein [Clostridiales bacterium]
MAQLTIHLGHQLLTVPFEEPTPLSTLLEKAGVSLAQPCGGRGTCGKCAVVLSGHASAPTLAEERLGVRLCCQAVMEGDGEVTLPLPLAMTQIAGGKTADLTSHAPMPGRLGAAVDIGTTTLALQLFDLKTGRFLGGAGMPNPQGTVAADVVGRMEAALQGRGEHLQSQVQDAIGALLAAVCAQAQVSFSHVDALVITGNTTMLYLLTGRNPEALSHAPFLADCLFGRVEQVLSRPACLPRCLHAFIGADTTCALLACGMTDRQETALLCDVGTNGELALWHEGKLYIASTAAGPAFEGAGIRYGCGSVPGAIDRVNVRDGELDCHTIGEGKAVGLCGSGLIDAVAAMLETEELDETGFLEDDFPLRDGVCLTPPDIRALQLAKAAICAGIQCVLSAAGCPAEKVDRLYLAGGFGSHLNLASAVKIGLIPEALADKVQVIGNGALDGAALMLMDTGLDAKAEALGAMARHVRLDGNAEFSNRYIEAMMFEEA